MLYHPPPPPGDKTYETLSPPGDMPSYLTQFVNASRPQKWTGGLDWIRWKVDKLRAVRSVLERIKVLQTEDAQRASAVKPWRFQGYEGVQTDSIRWGKRGGYLLWESSGEVAAATMASMGKSPGYALRIDLQLTLAFSSPQPHFGTSLIGSSQGTLHTQRRSRKLVGLSTRTDGLWLGTVGRRTSPSYLRIYDKGVESSLAPQGRLWRIEVEAKGTHADQLCKDHQDSLTDPKFCANYTTSSLIRSGCSWPFAALAESPVDIRLGRKEETTAGRLAIWLTHSVRPVLPRLLTVFTVAEVLEMLNLSVVAAPTGKVDVIARKPTDVGY